VASFPLLSMGIAPEQDKNMKIAFIDIYKRIPISSGGDWWMFQLCTDLARNNDLSTFYTSEQNSREGYPPEDVGFTTTRLESRIEWRRVSKWLEMLMPDFLWDKAQIRDIKADLVFTLVYGYHIAASIAKANDAPLILVMHNVEWQYVLSLGSLWHLPLRALENSILNRVDAIITISPRDYNYVVKHTSREGVFYIPPRPDVHVFNPEGARYDFGSDRFNVLFYGSLDRPQNQAALKFIVNELIPTLSRAHLDEVVAVHVFGSGQVPAGLLSGTRIDFIGAVQDPGFYIRGADAIIVPIKNPSGIKLRAIESLACGKPVVTTPEAAEGLPEELKAMLYVADTADAFVEALNGLRNGCLPNKTKASIVLHHTQGDRTDDVVRYALRKRRK
jgi:glycosyltransferase involved in cell wall biosynthesis